jgi:thioredoxin reductase
MIKSFFALLLVMSKVKPLKLNDIRRVAVIGAGAGGLITADILQKDGFDVVIFERASNVGGVWKYRDAMHSKSGPMYKSLRTNLPKQIMAYNYEIPFPDSYPSFLTHENVQSYLENFADSQHLSPKIIFGCSVVSITYVPPISEHESLGASEIISTDDTGTLDRKSDRPAWKLDFKWPDTPHEQIENKIAFMNGSRSSSFDAVVICNGHYNIPLMPEISDFSGLSEFQGEVMHSVDYNDPAIFKGKSVLVVGSRSSGTDLAREISAYADIVYASDRSLSIEKSAIHGNIHHKPGLLKLKSKDIMQVSGAAGGQKGSVQFADGTIANVDVLLWCTGYAYDYPFLRGTQSNLLAEDDDAVNSASVTVDKKRKVSNLYRQLFSIEHPSLAFVGLPYSVVPFPLFNLQAKWISSVYSGRTELPSKLDQLNWLEGYEKEVLQRYKGDEGTAVEKFHYLGDAQWDYFRHIAHASGGNDEKQMRYIDVLEQIYNDNASIRPPYPGAPDTYRDSEYTLNYDTFEWTRK